LEEFEIKVTSSTNSLDGLADSLTRCPALKKLTLNLSSSQVNTLDWLLKLSPQTLELTLTTEQRLSLKAIPKSVTSLEF